MEDPSTTPLTDAALAADSENGSTRELVALCRKLETMCSHAGILRAQEQHNAMMAEKDAEIHRLQRLATCGCGAQFVDDYRGECPDCARTWAAED